MALLEPSLGRLSDGTALVLRSARPGDARALIALTRAVLATSAYMVQEADEYTATVRGKRAWIASQQDSATGLYLVAEAAGRLVGFADCRAEHRRRRRHAVTLGLAIDAAWRGRGIGRALAARVLEWARANPALQRVELHVQADNAHAIALYRSLSFVEEGRRTGALKDADGRLIDDLLMCAFVGDGHAGA